MINCSRFFQLVMAWITETFAKYTIMSWVIFKNFNNRPFKLFIKIRQQLWGTRTFCYLEQLHLINCFIKQKLYISYCTDFKNSYFLLYLMLFLCVNLLIVLFWRFRDTDNYYQYSFFLILRSFIVGLQMGMGWHACYSHSSVMGAPLLWWSVCTVRSVLYIY